MRDKQSDKAQDLASLGVELVRGDFQDPTSLDLAMKDVHGVFSVVPSSTDVRYGLAVQDIGAIVAKLFADPSHHRGITIDIASDALSGNDIAAKISQATAQQVPYMQIPAAAAAQNPMIARLLQAMIGGKLAGQANIPFLRALHPGLLTFDRWLAAGHAEAIAKLLPPQT